MNRVNRERATVTNAIVGKGGRKAGQPRTNRGDALGFPFLASYDRRVPGHGGMDPVDLEKQNRRCKAPGLLGHSARKEFMAPHQW